MRCLIEEGLIQDAEQQLELLAIVQSDSTCQPLCLMPITAFQTPLRDDDEVFTRVRYLGVVTLSSRLYTSTGPMETGLELLFLRALLALRSKDSSSVAVIPEKFLDDVKDQLDNDYYNCSGFGFGFDEGDGKRICSSLFNSKFVVTSNPNFMLELAEVNDLPIFLLLVAAVHTPP